MSRPSSAMEVATNIFISPSLNFSIIAFCSFCFSPVVFPFACSLIACPTKLSAFTCGILFSSSEIVRTVSLYCAKIMILDFGSFSNCVFTSSFNFCSFGCSCSRVKARENAFANSGDLVSLSTPWDFFSAACWNRSFM